MREVGTAMDQCRDLAEIDFFLGIEDVVRDFLALC